MQHFVVVRVCLYVCINVSLTDTKACLDKPCRNGGTCSIDSTKSDDFVCLCPKGFQGKDCSGQTQTDTCFY